MKVIIAGGRDFNNYQLLKEKVDFYLWGKHDIHILSGKQVTEKDGEKYGADYLGEKYAEEKGYPVIPFPADWDTFGKSAGPIRNEAMAKSADALIAFWDGQSRGTKNMIFLARVHKLKIRVVNYR
jgi:hypothetical protein